MQAQRKSCVVRLFQVPSRTTACDASLCLQGPITGLIKADEKTLTRISLDFRQSNLSLNDSGCPSHLLSTASLLEQFCYILWTIQEVVRRGGRGASTSHSRMARSA